MTSESSRYLGQDKEPFLTWLWRKPSADEPRSTRKLRTLCRIVAIFVREFDRDAIPLRASALTFTIILSMVPVLALSTAVLKGLGAGNQMRVAAYQFIETLDTPTDSAPPPAAQRQRQKPAKENSATAPTPAAPPQSLTSHLKKAVDTIFDYVDKTNFATLGIFGIAGLFFTVISVLGTIEQAMNAVWQAESGRAWGRKVMDYLALMLLLPLAVNIGVATMAALQSETTLNILRHTFPAAWAGPLLIRLLSYSFLVMTLVILYRFLPNTRVPLLPAMVGALVGGIGWLTIQSVYISLQIGVARYNAIYGSFATLPLFFLWIYIGWMVFLAGAEVAFAVHVRHRYRPKHVDKPLTPRAELALTYDLLALILENFRNRQPTGLGELNQKLDAPDPAINTVLRKLRAAGLVQTVEGEDTAYLPGTSADRISAAEVLEVILGTDGPTTPGGNLATQALNDASASLADRTMATQAHDPGTRPTPP